MLLDHRFVMSFNNLKEKITEYLIHNYQKYIQYHEDSVDRLVYEATNFFNDSRRFTTDVVDVLIKATADTLNLKIKIYRSSPAGNIQCETVQAENPTREIMLEFSTSEGVSATFTGANHYNSVTRLNPTSNFRVQTESNSQMGDESTNNEASVGSASIAPVEELVNSENDAILKNNEIHTIPENVENAILKDNEFEIFGKEASI